MNSGIFKTIILGLVLVVFSFVLGSQVTESKQNVLMILGALCGGFLLLVMGKRCWWLLFIAGPIYFFLPRISILGYMPLSYTLGFVVLVYWLIMWAMGYVRVRWRGMWVLDAAALLFFGYLVVSYCRNPVGINMLDQMFALEESENMGGKAYFIAIFALLYYVTLSILPISLQEIRKVLKWTYVLQALAFLYAAPRAAVSTYNEAGSSRSGGMMPLGSFLVASLLCAYPLWSILLSPWRFAGLLLGYAGISLSGFRTSVAYQVCLLVFLSFLRRQIGCVLLLGACSLGCVYWASAENLLLKLPHGTQRVLQVLPGINIDSSIRSDASYSEEWRYKMWRWALDPRSGYIRDYVWGDGMGINRRESQQMDVQVARGTLNSGDPRYFAAYGVWHSGVIDAIHRLGIVGLAIITLYWLAVFYGMVRVIPAAWRTSGGFFIAYFVCPLFESCLGYYTAAGSTTTIVNSISVFALLKLSYCLLREEGTLTPLLLRKEYVPLAIREHEAAQAAKALEPAA